MPDLLRFSLHLRLPVRVRDNPGVIARWSPVDQTPRALKAVERMKARFES